MTAPPPLSVVMPVHDGRFLHDALQSISAQTFTAFELVVAMNGLSEDGTRLAREWASRDARIRLYQCPASGLVRSANEAVAQARAPVVARMDADDVAHPDRLRRQMAVFDEHADAVLVGVLADGIDAGGRKVHPRDRGRLLRRETFVPFPHGSAMFRRDAFDAVGGYRDACHGWEDLDLFLRLATHGRVFVIPDALYHYRYHTTSTTLRRSPVAEARIWARRHRCLVAYRAGMSYDHLLEAEDDQSAADGWAASAAASQTAYTVWAGQRPDVGLDVLRSARGPLRAQARAVLYGVGGHISPAALQLALRSWVRLRDLRASRHIGEGTHEWHFASSS